MPQALPPFSEYRLYKVFHKKENRWQAVLVGKNDRTTLSYARYLMSVHLGRILDKSEHVDHINGDKTDDRIENFQILTPKENRLKYNALDCPTELVKLKCPICGIDFSRSKSRAYQAIHKDKDQCCSRKCAKIHQYALGKSSVGVSKSLEMQVKIKEMHSQGLSGYIIAETLGINRSTVMKYW